MKWPDLRMHVMDKFPAGTLTWPKMSLEDHAQRMAGVVGAKRFRGLDRDDSDADCDRQPDA
jgi:hypothetical protein